MRIDRLEPLPRSGKCRLVFSDGSVLKTQPYLTAELGLYEGQELDDEQLQQLYAAAKKASAKERAVRIVASSGVSEKELKKRLVRKGEDAADAEQAVDWLKELHLLDDARTAEQLVASAVARGYGRARIRNLLYEKGIAREYWQQALSRVPPMDDAIDRFLRQRLEGGEADEKTVKKAVDALLRRGHSWSDIQAALRRYQTGTELEEDEFLEEME